MSLIAALSTLLERRKKTTDEPTESPECRLCGDPAECLVPRAPGMGNDHYCEDCCPRCSTFR